MYRCDYCDGIVEAKCISIQFQRYRHTNHSEPVTIVKTIHFTPERSSLPVISTVMRAHARIRIRCERVQCEHMRMRAFASHCMRTHFSCVMRPFAYVIWASSVSVMRAYVRIRMRCERIRIACARIRIACARIACECAHLRGTYACPVL